MPRKSKKQWTHPLYAIGYCYERYGRVYLRVKDKKKATFLIWDEKNKTEAIDLLEQFIRGEIFEIKEEYTISNVMPNFLEYIKNNTSEQNYNSYLSGFQKLINKDFPLADIMQIREHIQTNIFKLQNKYKHNTVSGIIGKVKAFFNYAIDNEYIDKNPINKSMTLGKIKSLHYTPKFEEYEIVIAKLKQDEKNIKLSFICELIRFTGMRISEVVNLKWSDIQNDYIVIHGKRISINQDRIRRFTTKPFPEISLLIEEIRKQNYSNEYVFGKIYRTYYPKVLNQICDELGIERFQFHALRRLSIRWWKTLGINRTDRSTLAGHDEATQKLNYDYDEELIKFADGIISQIKR